MGFIEELRGLLRMRALQLLALLLFLGWVAKFAIDSKFAVVDLDIWWHLKVGDWIVQHAGVPHNGIFSRTAANHPWVAYSWGYEVLLSCAYRWFGLVGVGMLGVLQTLAIAYALFWMLQRLSGRYWAALGLAVVTTYGFLFGMMPRPVFFSILLFIIELTLILEAHRTQREKSLYWLLPLFVLWANLHIQFVYGLAVIGLYAAVNVAQRLAAKLRFEPEWLEPPRLPATKTAVIAAGCVVATLIGPYSYHVYQVIYEYSKPHITYSIIIELQPMSFTSWMNFTALFLTAAGFFAVGWQKKIDAFKLALLLMASVVAFRTMRDAWFTCIPAAACIADLLRGESHEADESKETLGERAILAVAMVVIMFVLARNADFSERGLDRAMSRKFPVNAANYLRQNPVPGPLYNGLDWGGFLMWYVPQYPVAIDGRNDLYGDKMDKLFFDTQNGKNYQADPYLNQAGVVLLQQRFPLAGILKDDPRFELLYEDANAVLLARRNM